MRTGLGLAIALAIAVAAPASAITRDERAAIKKAVRELSRPETVCSRLTQGFLELNYGHDGRQGRKRCRRETRQLAKMQPDVGLRKMRILKATTERARVRVVDTDGDSAAFILVNSHTRRGWLLDGIENLHAT